MSALADSFFNLLQHGMQAVKRVAQCLLLHFTQRAHRTLQQQLLLVSALTMLPALLGLALYSASQQQQQWQLNMQQSTRMLADDIAYSAATHIMLKDVEGLEQLLLQMLKHQQVLKVSVADAEGRVLATALRDPHGAGQIRRDLEGQLRLFGRELMHEQDNLLSYTRSIGVNETLGLVQVVSNLDQRGAAQSKVVLEQGLLVVCALLLSLGLQQFGTRRTLDELRQIALFADLIRSQPGSQLHLPGSSTEFQALVQSLNQLTLQQRLQMQEMADLQAGKRGLLELSSAGIVQLGQDGRIVDANPAVQTGFGYGLRDLRGMTVEKILDDELECKTLVSQLAVLSPHYPQAQMQMQVRHADGRSLPARLRLQLVQTGRDKHFWLELQDLSHDLALQDQSDKNWQLAQQMQATNQFLKTALEQDSLLCWGNAHYNITWANQAYCNAFGLHMERVCGEPDRLLQAGMQEEGFYQHIRLQIARGENWHGELLNNGPDGEAFWLQASILPRLDSEGELSSYLALARDISSRKWGEQALLAAQQQMTGILQQIRSTLLWDSLPQQLQASLLASLPAQSGSNGEFLAFQQYSTDCYEILYGQVNSRQMQPMVLATQVKIGYRQLLLEQMAGPDLELLRPAFLINTLHNQLHAHLQATHSCVTLGLYRVDLSKRRIEYVNAGYPGVMLLRADGGIEGLLADNLPLGLLKYEYYRQNTLSFGSGDALLLYPKDLPSCKNEAQQIFGEEAFVALSKQCMQAGLPPAQILQKLRHGLLLHSGQASVPAQHGMVMLNWLDNLPHGQSNGCSQPQREAEYFAIQRDLSALPQLRKRLLAAGQLLPHALRERWMGCVMGAVKNIIRRPPVPGEEADIGCKLKFATQYLELELCWLSGALTEAECAAGHALSPLPSNLADSGGESGKILFTQSNPVPGICVLQLQVHFIHQLTI